MENPYKLSTINERVNEIITTRNEALVKIMAMEFPVPLTFYLSSKIHEYYQPELDALRTASEVAQWYISEAQQSPTPPETA